MADIKLSELCPAGSELLQDSESFLTELRDQELENVVGGDGVIVILEKPFFPLYPITKDISIGISIYWD
ncbi:MAG: hypothetical protein QNJ32_00540 [Xenococcaceae cyanobacterium MO_167.B27]|nr:hypothetical protein [Xenococcaceae cyanobacterium MO_167.B27]